MAAVALVRPSAGDPVLDTAVSRAVLDQVSDGARGETLRIYRPQPHVAFGRQDAVAAGYAEAVEAARAAGYEAVERLAGGRAAVFHEGTVAFAWAMPTASPRDGINERFEEVAAIIAAALGSLGVDARVGEVPGEYCPGEWSVNSGGRRKVMGVGQRIVRSAAHVGGVIVVEGADRVNDVLTPVYEAMDFAWDPSATGAVADEVEGVTFDAVVDALVAEISRSRDLVEAPLDDALLAAADSLRPHFVPSV
ncbi:MAG TPA: lipoate--protein ligase family protein [Acidimicrobiia bacterium]|nr:lipoate--protein ligase family protein [Acidimicrobiia bacterium]